MAWSLEKTGNPSLNFVRFFVNGEDILTHHFRTVSFSYERMAENAAASKFTLELFDESWADVELLLFKTGDKTVYFDYGYVNHDRSPVYYGRFTSVKPRFDSTGMFLTITGSGFGMITGHLIQQSDTFRNKPISEIVRTLAEKYKYKVGYIEPTRRVASIGDPNNVNRSFERHNMSFYQFVTNVLTPHAVSLKTGRGDYRLIIDETTNPPTINYAPPDYSDNNVSDNTIRDYIVYRDRMGEVVAFDPDIELNTLYGMTGGVLITNTIDKEKKQTVSSIHDPSKDPIQIPKGDNKTFYPKNEEEPNRVIIMPGQSLADIRNRQKALADAQRNLVYNATLSIVGDPLIIPHRFIRITLMTPQNVPHYTSGIYYIVSTVDSVSASEFTSVLTLKRNSGRGGTDITNAQQGTQPITGGF